MHALGLCKAQDEAFTSSLHAGQQGFLMKAGQIEARLVKHDAAGWLWNVSAVLQGSWSKRDQTWKSPSGEPVISLSCALKAGCFVTAAMYSSMTQKCGWHCLMHQRNSSNDRVLGPRLTWRPLPLPSFAPSMIPGKSNNWILAPRYLTTPGTHVSVVNSYEATCKPDDPAADATTCDNRRAHGSCFDTWHACKHCELL